MGILANVNTAHELLQAKLNRCYKMLRVYVYASPPPAKFWLPWAIIQWIFVWVCSKHAPSVWKNMEKLQFAVQTEIFRKKLFYPTTIYSSLCSSECACMKILFLAENSCEVVIYTKNWGPHANNEVLKNSLKTGDLLSGLMFHIQAFAAENE